MTAWTKDPRLAKQFCSRREAVATAKAIGYPLTVTHDTIMGFLLWFICDDHLNLLTQDGLDARRQASESVQSNVGWMRDWL